MPDQSLTRIIQLVVDASAAVRETEKFTQSQKKAESQTSSFSRTLKLVGAGLAALTGGLTVVAAGRSFIKLGEDFQSASRDIVAGTGASGEKLDQLNEDLKAIYATAKTSVDTSGIAGLIATLNTFTGATGEDLQILTTKIADASNILGEEAGAIAQSLGQASQAFGIGATDLSASVDAMFRLSQDFGISLSQLSGNIKEYGPVLANAGYTIDETAAFFARLEQQGIAASAVVPAINMALRNAASEGVTDLKGYLEGTMQAIADATSETEALALASASFGEEGSARMATFLRNSADAAEAFSTQVAESQGAIQETAREQQTLAEAMRNLGRQFEVAAAPISQDFVAALTDAAQWVSDNKEIFAQLSDTLRSVSEWVVELVTALKGFSDASGITTALGLVGGALLDIAKTIPGLIENITQATTAFSEWATDLGLRANAAATALSDAFSNLPGKIGTALSNVWQTIRSSVLEWVSGIVELGKEIGAGLMRGILSYFTDNSITRAFGSVKDTVVGGFRDVFGIRSPSRVMIPVGEDITAGIGVGIASGTPFAVQAIQQVGADLSVEAQKMANGLSDLFSNVLGSLFSGGGLSGVFDALETSVIGSVADALAGAFSQTTAAGVNFSGFGQGVASGLSGVMSGALTSAVTGAIGGGGFGGALTGALTTALGGAFSGALGTIGGGILSGFNALTGAFTGGGLSGITSAITGAGSALGGLGAALGAVVPIIGGVGILISAFSTKTKEIDKGITLLGRRYNEVIKSYSEIEKSRFFGLSKSRGFESEELDDNSEAARSISQAMAEMRESIYASAKAVGVGQKAFDGFWKFVRISLDDKDAEERAQAIAKGIQDIGNSMAEMVPGLDEFAQAGETASETLTRLGGSLTGVNAVLDYARFDKLSASLESAAKASELLEGFGGVENFASSMQTFTGLFRSAREQMELETRALRKQFNGIAEDFKSTSNITFPKTREAYVDLVEGLNLNKTGHQQLYTLLLTQASAFDKILPVMEETADTSEEAAEAIAKVKEEMRALAESANASELVKIRDLQRQVGGETAKEIKKYYAALEAQRALQHAEELAEADEAGQKLKLVRRRQALELALIEQNMQEEIKALRKAAANDAKDTAEDTADAVSKVTKEMKALARVANADELVQLREIKLDLNGPTNKATKRYFDALQEQAVLRHKQELKDAEEAGQNLKRVRKRQAAELALIERDLQTELAAIRQTAAEAEAAALQNRLDKLTSRQNNADEKRASILGELTRRAEVLRDAEQALADQRASIAASDLAPGTPRTQFAEIRRQFEDAVAAGRTGDTAAAANAATLAQQVLTAGQQLYASGTQYGDIFREVNLALSGLQRIVGNEATQIEKQITAADMRDIQEQQTDRLLRGLAQLDARLARLVHRQEQTDRRLEAVNGRNSLRAG